MKTKLLKLRAACMAGLVAAVLPTQAAQVSEAEAVQVAQWLLDQEITGGWSGVDSANQEVLLAGHDEPLCKAVWLEGTQCVFGDLPADKEALARVVMFPTGGYVVVGGDDQMEPVPAFDAQGTFVWEGDAGEVARDLLSGMLSSWHAAITSQTKSMAADETLVKASGNWSKLRSMVGGMTAPQASGEEEEYSGPVPMAFNETLVTASWSQGGFYNDELQTHVGNDNSVPVGCTATMMGTFMRYFSWPTTASGSNSYWDECPNGSGNDYYHSVTLGYHSWGSMPLTSLTTANSHVADLLYETGVMVGMNYDDDGSGAWLSTAVMQNSYFYRGIETKYSSHETPIATTVMALVPAMLSTPSHSMVCDGYRDTTSPYFHINAGHDGSSDGWYSLTALPAGDPVIERSYPYCTPNNWAYVNVSHSGTENGDMNTPYNTLSEGSAGVTTGGQLWMKAGSYVGAGQIGTYTKRMTIKSYGGSVLIR